MKKTLLLVFSLYGIGALGAGSSLESKLKGTWVLKDVTCNGLKQTLSMDYTMSFDGSKGAYVSKAKGCTQVEREKYTYRNPDTVAIKQGIRECAPSACQADLPADKCGKETNPQTPSFKVAFMDDRNTMILSTDDPKSIDCSEPGQGKPAVFTFKRQ